MIHWAQLLHFYQPPTQRPEVLRKICDESYRPLIDVFRQHRYAKATVNINGVLTEMLYECGHNDVIEGLKELAERGQIEFTGSGKYHPIFPLIPKEESERQIRLNNVTNKHFFGDAYQPSGFFPPELCYSPDIAESIIDSGYKWIIVSGIACQTQWPLDEIHSIRRGQKLLRVFFRDNIISNKISFQEISPAEFLQNLKQLKQGKENIYVVTAMDAETYGHHIQHWEKLFLAEVYEEIQPTIHTFDTYKQITPLARRENMLLANGDLTNEVRAVTISELLDAFPTGDPVEPIASSWSTDRDDLNTGNPFPLWQDKENEIHRLQWEHIGICIDIVSRALKDSDNDESRKSALIARGLLDRALHSCQFWWASRRPMWDINLIHMGLIEQWRVIVNAYRSINLSGTSTQIKTDYYHKLVAARDMRNKITDRLFM